MAPEKMTRTIAETWLQRIDKPMTAGGFDTGISKKAVKRMQEAGEEVGEVRGTYIYLFKIAVGCMKNAGTIGIRPTKS